MTKISLHFVGVEFPELFETGFTHPVLGGARRCVRGKRAGAYQGYSTFQWTKAVQALCILFLRAKAQSIGRQGASMFCGPQLVGDAMSFAASLDYAIDKQTTWLLDMLGWDRNGRSIARRAINRTNPGRKRMGPVALSFNGKFLEDAQIELFLDDEPLEDVARIREIERKIQSLEMPVIERKLEFKLAS